MDLLASKFYYPPHRLDFVQRPQILATLNAGLHGKLTLVSAPAGFGKTTAVSEWIRDGGYPAAWLSLDKNDNDPSRFLIYLIAALQHIDPEIGADVQAVLEEPLPPNFEILLTRLMNEMEKLPDKSIIVLDDYHLIDSKPVHDAINFLIEYLPSTVHLVITGRADPPLPISRLRVRGDVNEVRTSQLRFTEKEAAAFLNEQMGFALLQNDIQALEARTEGWIASLKLAAFSMQGRNDRSAFITEFSGSNRYVIDYLVDEVMVRQPEEVQTFLRRTSILERFCAPLCEYVAGSRQDMDVIEYLDRSNLFLIPLDDHREWYRYHHLFADFLSQRLRATERDKIPELHRRASHWFEMEGLADEAIQHAQAAGDMERATRLVAGIAADLVMRAEVNKLVKLFEQLPSELSQGYPMLCIWYAWALLFMGQLEKVEPALAIVESNPKKVPEAPNSGYVTTVRAYLVTREGDLLRSIQLCEQALEEMSTASSDGVSLIFRGSVVIWLALNHRLLGNLDQARQLFLEAADVNRNAGNFFAALSSYEQLAGIELICGHLNQAVDLFRKGLDLAQNWKDTEGKPLRSFMAAAGLQHGLGAALYQMNDLEAAAAHIQWSAEYYELGESLGRLHSYTDLAYLRQAKGDYETSAELLRKAWTIEETIMFRRSYSTFQPSHTKLAILLSRESSELAHLLMDASRRVERLGIDANDQVDFCTPADYLREAFYVDLACLLIAQGRAAEALSLLSRLLEAAVKMERHGDEMRYWVIISLAQHAMGNTEAALDALSHALALAKPQGYVRLFVDEGQPMAELLRLAVSQKISPAYAGTLLAAFPKKVLSEISNDKKMAVHAQMLAEPLSEREIEVLRLMADGYKYEEIADKLIISINTVRHHTRNVYGKLGVNSRTQALSRAKALNLL